MKVEMSWVKETPGTHVYRSDEPNTFIPSLYIKKQAFTGTVPDAITVTVTFE